MNRTEDKMKAMEIINSVFKTSGRKSDNTVAERIVDLLGAHGWRGPDEILWIKEMVFDQARMAEGNNPYKEGK